MDLGGCNGVTVTTLAGADVVLAPATSSSPEPARRGGGRAVCRVCPGQLGRRRPGLKTEPNPRPQRMKPALERRELPLRVAQCQGHVGVAVVELAHMARHHLEAAFDRR